MFCRKQTEVRQCSSLGARHLRTLLHTVDTYCHHRPYCSPSEWGYTSDILSLRPLLGQFGMCLIEIEFGVQKIAAKLIPKPGFPRCLCALFSYFSLRGCREWWRWRQLRQAETDRGRQWGKSMLEPWSCCSLIGSGDRILVCDWRR